MFRSFNCCVLSSDSKKIFPFPILDDIDEKKYVNIKNKRIDLDDLAAEYLREFMCPELDASVTRELKLWKVNVDEDEIKVGFTDDDIKEKLNGSEMRPYKLFEEYFKDELAIQRDLENIHIITVIPTATGKCLPMFYLSNKKFAFHYFTAETYFANLFCKFLFFCYFLQVKRQ